MECELLWLIENYSCSVDSFWLFSPWLTPDALERTSWSFGLCPIVLRVHGYGHLLLQRRKDDAGPETLSVKLEISIVKVDGSVLFSERCERAFRKGGMYLFGESGDMSELFVRKNTDFLPRDSLVVLCRMSRVEGRPGGEEGKRYAARTVFETEKLCFTHKITHFSLLEMNEKKRLEIPSFSEKGCVYYSDVWISTKDSPEGSIIVDVRSSNRSHRLISKQISVISANGSKTELSEVDYRFRDAKEKEEEMRKYLTRQFFLDRRREFLPNDELTLSCECTFNIGSTSNTVREIQQEFLISPNKNGSGNSQAKNDTKVVKRSSNPIASETQKRNNFEKSSPSHPTALDNFKALYQDQLRTDVQIKSVTKSFPADKTVVCARTSASRSMLRQDTKAKSTYCVKVDDSEDEIGRALLLFYYSDSLKDLRWGSALRIYHDASSHAVKSLKILSSYFLVDNLGTTNASQLLLLADRHADKQLKEIVENFILENDKEVFSSEGWEKLSKTNSKLGVETMLLKYKREKPTK